mmetsp:Transcript_17442/g.52321  ORF Transcript_17442/g.52321 Transcript_17442/m.52321 type:complete len:248 (+) Transcript_17442:1305-2048(+)
MPPGGHVQRGRHLRHIAGIALACHGVPPSPEHGAEQAGLGEHGGGEHMAPDGGPVVLRLGAAVHVHRLHELVVRQVVQPLGIVQFKGHQLSVLQIPLDLGLQQVVVRTRLLEGARHECGGGVALQHHVDLVRVGGHHVYQAVLLDDQDVRRLHFGVPGLPRIVPRVGPHLLTDVIIDTQLLHVASNTHERRHVRVEVASVLEHVFALVGYSPGGHTLLLQGGPPLLAGHAENDQHPCLKPRLWRACG